VYASNAIPQQVYDNISVLEQEHYIGHKDVSTLSREELAYYVAGILEKQPSDFDMLLSTRILEDETQLTLVREQEASAKKRLNRLLKDYKDTSELLYRKSIQGENRLEVMTPLKQKHDKLEAEYKNFRLSRFPWATHVVNNGFWFGPIEDVIEDDPELYYKLQKEGVAYMGMALLHGNNGLPSGCLGVVYAADSNIPDIKTINRIMMKYCNIISPLLSNNYVKED
jgi:hypothetical protein